MPNQTNSIKALKNSYIQKYNKRKKWSTAVAN